MQFFFTTYQFSAIKKVVATVFITLFFACQPAVYEKTKNSSINISETTTEHQQAKGLISPYKDSLEKEMNEVLVISAEEFPKEKGKPETKLGNLVADLSLEIANKMYDGNIDFCMLNFGGLRTSLPKGEITKGKIFELMPFENELVVVTITLDSLNKLLNYLYFVSAQPISNGLTLEKYEIFDGQTFKEGFSTKENKYRTEKEFKILTSDYLSNGGDNMTFFLNPINYEKVGIKLRDAIIQYCAEQHAQRKQLNGKIEGRIVYE
ncbi:MAG: 5'-nucleotidase C-terminal domain-containing protein [Vicingaceae bacterium]|nr:5'-nucleotidase C-terminal domain-containing protein [Vicingaceae bacterium]